MQVDCILPIHTAGRVYSIVRQENVFRGNVLSEKRPDTMVWGKMRMCGSTDVVTGNFAEQSYGGKSVGVTGNLQIQNCGSKTADTTLIESFA